MYYIYFLPKQMSVFSETKPWGYPLRIGFQNQHFADYYVQQLRQIGYKAFVTSDPSNSEEKTSPRPNLN